MVHTEDRGYTIDVFYLKTFERDAKGVLSADDVAAFVAALKDDPDRGVVINGAGGFRKVRWALPGTGKSGGVRVIYYYRASHGEISSRASTPRAGATI